MVIEAHSVEDVSDMGGALGTIRQAAVLRASLVINLVTPAWLPVDLWACMKHTEHVMQNLKQHTQWYDGMCQAINHARLADSG